MNPSAPITFASPLYLAAGAVLTLILVLLVHFRQPPFPEISQALALLAMILLSIAAGGLAIRLPSMPGIVVMVDLSPSTRIADYRDRQKLDRRLNELLSDAPRQIQYFADGIVPAPAVSARLADVPAERTTFPPATADVLVVLTDARFELPALAPPTYIVPDPALESPQDAAIGALEIRGDSVAARIENSGPARQLTVGASPEITRVPAASIWAIRNGPFASNTITAQLNSGDAWPENDFLSIPQSPPSTMQRWWVGGAAPAGWRELAPDHLPLDAASYLNPSVIVLNNVPAEAVPQALQDRLTQYVRDLGGAVVILGGDHAFSAGSYDGSTLSTISPLASSPPAPALHWILLVDSSGSMSQSAGSGNRWDLATTAMMRLLRDLPPEDAVSLGSFSNDLRWWPSAKNVAQTIALPLPPASAIPQGPTNLQTALKNLPNAVELNLEKNLLLITDGEAQLDDSAGLSALLSQKKIHLSALAIGNGAGLSALRQISAATGGSIIDQPDPSQWTASAQKLMHTVAPQHLSHSSLQLQLAPGIEPLPGSAVDLWNRTWLKPAATLMASAQSDSENVPLIARWQLGAGSVIAAAFPPSSQLAGALAELISRPPRDPRFSIAWQSGPKLTVTVNAVNGSAYMNDLPLTVELVSQNESSAAPQSYPMEQSAPGRYEVSIPSPRSPTFATLRLKTAPLDRRAIAGRYAHEFDAIGNDRRAMRDLAERTGGRVIEPQDHRPIDFKWPLREVSLAPILAALAAALLAAALITWKHRRVASAMVVSPTAAPHTRSLP